MRELMKDTETGEWVVISDEDVERLIAAFPAKWKLALRMLAIYGLRITELLGLTPANIRIENGEHVLVFQRIKRGHAKCKECRAAHRKGFCGQGSCGKAKPPIISRMAIPERIRTELLTVASTRLPSVRLFPITRVNFWRHMQSAAYRSGVDPRYAHPHSFRHNRGRYFVQVPGCTIWQAQAMLGHRSLVSMHPYTQLASSVETSKRFLG